ncbi:MAG: ABC transporter ATP-binding protein [Paludibacteraceae bacterium]|nr:ABC transporter ATP-binding protein [Paludibacteraceae bacterium]
MNAIEIKNISKSYGEIKALDNVSFEVQKGELFGLIGPDGAGKTTLFRLLTTLINPDAGSATVDGLDMIKDYREIRTRVGYMPGRFSLYPDLSVEENLQFFAAIFGVTVQQSYHLIEPIYKQIEPFKTRRAGKLSGGMKQKLALSCALIHCPSVLFLDEPTTGVDAVSRSEFWDMLSNLKKQGITILVSTPYMDEASRCDRIALMNEGKILGIDTPENMVKAFDLPLYGVKAKNMFALLEVARKQPGVLDCYPFGEKHHLVADASFNADDMKKTLVNVEGFCIEPVVPTIEDMFIKLMKQWAR